WAVTSVFIGQNHLAASLGLLLPLVAGFGLIWPGWRRWLAGATVIAGLVVLFFTGSSLTLIAVLVASLVFAGAGLAVVRADARKRLVAGLVVLASLVIAGWFVLPATVQDRVRLGTIGITQSFEARIALARQGIELALEHPLSGHGPGATEEIVHVTLEGQPTLRALHNVTLEFAVTYGVAAAALVGVWLLWLVTQLVRQLRRSGARQQWSIIAVLASLAALLIVQSVPSTFEGVRAPFIVVGFALALAMQRSRSKYVASQVVSS
ncbi:MAG: O-antigen ligase family protein, partial [bacterium]|nr:O-antigen ligase family protein [bacterium]